MRKESKLNAAALAELGDSFSAEVKPLLVEVQALVDALTQLCCFILFSLIAFSTFRHGLEIREWQEVSIDLAIPIYPFIFISAFGSALLALVLLTKTDLLEVLDDFDPQRAEKYLRQLATEAPMLQLAARRNIDIDSWLNWLRCEVEAQRSRVKNNQILRPNIQPEGAVLHDADNHHHEGHEHSHHHPHSHSHSHSKKHSHS